MSVCVGRFLSEYYSGTDADVQNNRLHFEILEVPPDKPITFNNLVRIADASIRVRPLKLCTTPRASAGIRLLSVHG